MSLVRKHTALLLVEGFTEVEFYNSLADKKFKSVTKKIKNLEGNFNINAKIIDAAYNFSQQNDDSNFDVYVCVDQERVGSPPFNYEYVVSEIQKLERFKTLHPVIANIMIESLFFIDIDGIYNFLRAKHSTRNPKKYTNFRILRHQDLSKVFKTYGSSYSKGKKCQGLVNSLDLEKIIKAASEISSLIELVNSKGKGKTESSSKKGK